MIAAITIGGSSPVNLTFVFFLIGISTEVIFFFEEQPIFTSQKVRRRQSGDAPSNDQHIHLPRRLRLWERMAVSQFVRNLEMIAFDDGRWRMSGRFCEECLIDGTSGGDGTCNGEFDEVA